MHCVRDNNNSQSSRKIIWNLCIQWVIYLVSRQFMLFVAMPGEIEQKTGNCV